MERSQVIPALKAHTASADRSSLTATLSKLLESFVGSWILDRIEDKFDKHQYGALKGRSILVFVELVFNSI